MGNLPTKSAPTYDQPLTLCQRHRIAKKRAADSESSVCDQAKRRRRVLEERVANVDSEDESEEEQDDDGIQYPKDEQDDATEIQCSKPLPRLVIYGDFRPKPLLDQSPAVFQSTIQGLQKLKQAAPSIIESAMRAYAKENNHLIVRTDFAQLIPPSLNAICDPHMDHAAERLGYNLTRLQRHVCHEIVSQKRKRDVIFVAPTGSGKSAAFRVPALLAGKGITLVIEPLRALIESQLKAIKPFHKYIKAEKLHSTQDEDPDSGIKRAENRLAELVVDNETQSKPLILFSTPDLCKERVARQLERLWAQQKLERIVMDEFDYVDETNASFREDSYKGLISRFREHCPGVQVVFLSATQTNFSIMDGLSNSNRPNKAFLFLSDRPLPDNLEFKIERKESTKQACKRILLYMAKFKKNTGKDAKVLCFCLTPQLCRKFAMELSTLGGVKAETVVGKNNDLVGLESTNGILERFRQGTTQVLCCTKVLERGVDVPDIDFVFHCVIPLSLRGYVQEAGRGGRDGRRCLCVLFFSMFDISTAKMVLRGNPDTVQWQDLEGVVHYGMSWECRYKILSQFVRSGNVEFTCASRRKCECCKRLLSNPDVSRIFLSTLPDFEKKLSRRLKENLIQYGCNEPLNAAVCNQLAGVGKKKSMIDELERFFWVDWFRSTTRGKYAGIAPKREHYESFVRKLQNSKVAIKLVNNEGHSQVRRKAAVTHRRVAVSRLSMCRSKSNGTKRPLLPFFVEFELFRLNDFEVVDDVLRYYEADVQRLLSEYTGESQILDLLDNLEQLFRPKTPWNHRSSIVQCCISGKNAIDRGTADSLYFEATLQKDEENLVLQRPTSAQGRRIFRKYGSHRFLHVHVGDDVPLERIKKFFGSPKLLFGREWSLLWVKRAKRPQTYVLFAEDGKGIEQMKVEEVWAECIPRTLNMEIGLGKFAKRMKLSFSKTSLACIMPKGTVEILPDFNLGIQFQEIDGGGLVSRQGLDYIWSSYRRNNPSCNFAEEEVCPYTGFTGRLGGIKGAWILDTSIGHHDSSIFLQVRTSQIKYDCPHTCIKGLSHQGKSPSPLYDALEVCNWDTVSDGDAKLNNRLIQILEARGVPIDLLTEIAAREMDEILQLVDLPRRAKDYCGSSSWTTINSQMTNSLVQPNEPFFVKVRTKIATSELKSVVLKSHYPLKNSRYLRMHADHTMLLDEGEVFVGMHEAHTIEELKDILAIRSPSYFKQDLRKLKIVSLKTLTQRALHEGSQFCDLPAVLRRSSKEKILFFENLRGVIILCNEGKRSEADRMSGGDYDGDLAFVTWNKEIVNHVQREDEIEISPYDCTKNELELIPFWNSKVAHHLHYYYHYRYHQSILGKYSEALDNVLDCFGFDHEFSKDIGRAAFFQVDEPFQIPKLRADFGSVIEEVSKPCWKLDPIEEKAEPANAINRASALVQNWRLSRKKYKKVIEKLQAQGPSNHFEPAILHYAENPDPEWENCAIDYRLSAEEAIHKYPEERKRRLQAGERIFEWEREFCDGQKKKLESLPIHRQQLGAAILYQVACRMEFQSSMNFVWRSAHTWLTSIVASKDGPTHAHPQRHYKIWKTP